jgi:DNA-binding NtrC family response regulator
MCAATSRGVCIGRGRTGLPTGLTLAEMEKLLIRDALRRNEGNRAAAARELGVDASTLFRKLKTLGDAIEPSERKAAR